MLETINNEMKIGIVVLITLGLGYLNHTYNKHKMATPAAYVVLVAVAAILIYNIVNSDEETESFDVNPSPIINSQNELKCYSEGDEIPCEELNAVNNAPEYNANNLELNQQNEQNNINENDISGSYGVNKDSTYKEVKSSLDSNQLPNECYPKDILSPKELLPTDNKSTWAQSVPAGQGSLGDQNFLNAGFHIGINTVGQTLRNPNYGLRSEPPNPQVKVSPWMQTTIEPDTNRRAMEINA